MDSAHVPRIKFRPKSAYRLKGLVVYVAGTGTPPAPAGEGILDEEGTVITDEEGNVIVPE